MAKAELPWGDCKVAFGVGDEERVWRAWGPGVRRRHRLPVGWSLCETDGSGARSVAVFRVAGRVPTVEDGTRVIAALRKIGAYPD